MRRNMIGNLGLHKLFCYVTVCPDLSSIIIPQYFPQIVNQIVHILLTDLTDVYGIQYKCNTTLIAIIGRKNCSKIDKLQ